MKVTNWNVYGLYEAIVGSGLPKLTEYNASAFSQQVEMLKEKPDRDNRHLARAFWLADLGSPHCNFLTGITVSFNISATQAFFLQAHRYHWWQIVSSQSKMHRLKQMINADACGLSDYVHEDVYENLCNCSKDSIEDLVYNCPMGLVTTEMVSTNYMQLRTIWHQRHTHPLAEWGEFCAWIEGLPLSGMITGNDNGKRMG